MSHLPSKDSIRLKNMTNRKKAAVVVCVIEIISGNSMTTTTDLSARLCVFLASCHAILKPNTGPLSPSSLAVTPKHLITLTQH